ncbi:MAG: TMEM165/GDT1 family protein [Candidatus Lokiarchaeota archaeon]|nr:TMEM165/GDT1 family protein [Candidatus Lokiarchaeota archaeon]
MDITIILLTYGILFLGELGDKTQLIVFNLALEYKKFYKVGIGVTIGFALLVTIGVFFGVVITQFVPIFIISIISGVVFIIIGILEARTLKELYSERITKDLIISSNEKKQETTEDKKDLPSKFSKFKNNPYLAGFVYIFLMELGDKTQILTITLASRYTLPFEVWVGSFLALISVAWIGILFGAFIAQKVPIFYLKLISTSIFIFVGILILITSF